MGPDDKTSMQHLYIFFKEKNIYILKELKEHLVQRIKKTTIMSEKIGIHSQQRNNCTKLNF